MGCGKVTHNNLQIETPIYAMQLEVESTGITNGFAIVIASP